MINWWTASWLTFSRQCWICLASSDDEDDDRTHWLHPCRCTGTSKWAFVLCSFFADLFDLFLRLPSARWVHDTCLQMWIDEKQKNNTSLSVSCSQCNTEYVILFPVAGKLFSIMDLCDKLVYSSKLLHHVWMVILLHTNHFECFRFSTACRLCFCWLCLLECLMLRGNHCLASSRYFPF